MSGRPWMHVDPAQVPADLKEPAMDAGYPPERTWDQVVTSIFGDCIGHDHEQVGRCVYCGQCGRRLYQGTVMPAGERAELKEALQALQAARDAR
jgi:hypothetical protein